MPAKLDAVKTYMRMRRVPEHLKIKVIKWFDYLWMTQKSSDEDKSVGFLPGKLLENDSMCGPQTLAVRHASICSRPDCARLLSQSRL